MKKKNLLFIPLFFMFILSITFSCTKEEPVVQEKVQISQSDIVIDQDFGKFTKVVVVKDEATGVVADIKLGCDDLAHLEDFCKQNFVITPVLESDLLKSNTDMNLSEDDLVNDGNILQYGEILPNISIMLECRNLPEEYFGVMLDIIRTKAIGPGSSGDGGISNPGDSESELLRQSFTDYSSVNNGNPPYNKLSVTISRNNPNSYVYSSIEVRETSTGPWYPKAGASIVNPFYREYGNKPYQIKVITVAPQRSDYSCVFGYKR